MSDDNKISLDVELNEKSASSAFGTIESKAGKSAKESASAFGEAFQSQENELKTALDALVKTSNKAARESAKESADVFVREFERRNKILLASQKQNIDNAMSKIMGSDHIKKSAADSAAAFEELMPEQPKQQVSPFNTVNLAAGLFLIQQGYRALKDLAIAASDFIAEGDKAIKVEKCFEALAKQAGIAANVIKSELVGAAKGMVDDEELLALASESFIQLGANAKRLPEVLELAKKSYEIFGGSVVANAEKINQAIFTGNTRALKDIGLRVDAARVYKEFAASMGTVPQLLTEQQKQQAILNRVLEQGAQKFKDVKVDTNNYSDSLTILKVSIQGAVGELAKLASSQIGSRLSEELKTSAKQLDLVKAGITALNDPNSIEGMESKVAVLNASLEFTKKQFSELSKIEKFFLGPAQQKIIDEQTNALARLNAQIAIAKGDLESQSKTPDIPEEEVDTTARDEYLRRRQELAAKVIELNSQVNQSEIALAQERFQRVGSLENLEALSLGRRAQAEATFLQNKQALEKFFADNGVNDEMLKNQAREAVKQTHENNMLLIEQQAAAERKRIIDDRINDTYSLGSAFEDMASGFMATEEELLANTKKTFKEMGKQMRDGLGTSAANAFSAFGAALVNGDNALDAFVQSFLKSMGQMAVQSGTRFILEGLAWLTVPGFQGVGGAMIAAGAALATFGGALSAVAGGGAPSAKSGAGEDTVPGGGISGGDSPITNVGTDNDTEPEKPRVQVSINVQGNVLDNRETGLALAQIIEQQFSEQGLVIRGAS